MIRVHPPDRHSRRMIEKGPAAYIAEFVGTFFLVLAICGVSPRAHRAR